LNKNIQSQDQFMS